MGLISRLPKAAGGTGFTPITQIKADEVDSDFDTAYTLINGNIEDANIKAAANIQQSKILNLTTDLNTIRAERVTEVNGVVFTVDGVYTKPADLLFARVIVIGGGGGGGGAQSTVAGAVSSGGGGGSGGYSESWFPAALIGATEVVSIGQGGAANGGNGQPSTFGSLVGANGGLGGQGLVDSIGTGGDGGSAGGGQIAITGCPGGVGFITVLPTTGLSCGGPGGANGPYMVPGAPTPTIGTATGGAGFLGGGGAGAGSVDVASAAGGMGGPGMVFIMEFKA